MDIGTPILRVFVAAMLPVLENRFAIPYGVAAEELSPTVSTIAAALGNIAVLIIAMPLLYRFGHFAEKRISFFRYVLKKTHVRHRGRFEKTYDIALVTLVAIPLPGSGVWTGMLASFVFGLPLRHAMALCALGSVIGSAVIGLATAGVVAIWHF